MRANSTLPAFGYEHLEGALTRTALDEVQPLFDLLGPSGAGYRLPVTSLQHCRVLTEVGEQVAAYLGSAARPVRALLFDKRAGGNWSLGWHQDRTIEVRQRSDTPGYGPWTIKAGRPHVAPPFALLEQMITVRVHLDPVDKDNAPLLVAPGSHMLGPIPEQETEAVLARCGQKACLADRGDLWLYSTPILHASDAAVWPRNRRVLQLDYTAEHLPAGLDWAV